MPQYVIERDMPGVGKLGASDLKNASQTSCDVLRDLGPQIQWVHSYVTDDKIYCLYRAPNEEVIRKLVAETAALQYRKNKCTRSAAGFRPTRSLR